MQRPTSKIAEQRVKHFRESHKSRILAAMEKLPVGGTFEEIAARAGLTDSQVWKRQSELERDGLIFNTNLTRKLKSGSPGIVWQLVSRKEIQFDGQIKMFQ